MPDPPSPPGAARRPGIALVPFDSEPARWVTAQAEAELVARYGFVGDRHQSFEDALFTPPAGAFWVAPGSPGSTPIGGVGLRQIDHHEAEVKRLWVAAAARGAGVGRALMDELEAAARRFGYRRLRLETGNRQPEAAALYRGSGWTQQEIGWDGGCIATHSLHFAKDLD